MIGACYASGIDPSAIPGEELHPDVVEAAADALTRDADRVRQSGSDAVRHWRALPGYYQAPEAEQLFAAMEPVADETETFATALTSVAAALRGFAEEVRPLKSRLAAVRADAWAFRSAISGNPEWEYDQGLVDRNTALVGRVNTLQVQLWDAERRCANAIRALYCAAPWHAADGSGDGLSYGVEAIPTDAEMAWGSEVQRKDHCPKAAAVQTKRFVWDGVVVDGLWGGVTGLGVLVGIDGTGWHWETMRSSWVGIGALIGYADGQWSWGTAGDGWTALGKGLVSWDTWADDPGRAAGGAVFNVAVTVASLGAVGAAKTASAAGRVAATGRAARVGRFLVAADEVLAYTDPLALGIKGAGTLLPRLSELAGSMVGRLDALANGLDLRTLEGFADAGRAIDDLDVAVDLDAARVGDDVTGGGLDITEGPDGTDVPVRDPDLTGTASPADTGPQHAPEPARVGADDTHPTGTSGSSAADEATTTHGDDAARTDSPDATGEATRAGDPATATTGDGPPPQTPTGPHGTSDSAGQPGRIAIDETGMPYVVQMADHLVTGHDTAFTEVLDRVIADHGLTRDQFDQLATKHTAELSRAEVTTLVHIREALPPVTAETILQKVINPRQALTILGERIAEFVDPEQFARLQQAGTMDLDNLRGFVARAADAAGMNADELYRALGLGGEGSPFHQGESVFAIRYQAGGTAAYVDPSLPVTENPSLAVTWDTDAIGQAMTQMPDWIDTLPPGAERTNALTQWLTDTHPDIPAKNIEWAMDSDNLFRGTGVATDGSLYAPEVHYTAPATIPDGAEMWAIAPDGTRHLTAVFHAPRWYAIVEQPLEVIR